MPISKSERLGNGLSLFAKCSSNSLMGRGFQKHHVQDARGILKCSIRKPVEEQQTLEGRIAEQCVRKIKH